MNAENKNKKSLKATIGHYFEKYNMYIILIGCIIIFQVITDGIFMRPLNLTNLALQNSHIFILSIGMLLVVLLGHVDLSVGSVVGLVGAISAILMVNYNMHPALAIPLCLLIGGLIGAWNGYWISYAGIPAFIVTLAGQLMFRGLTQVLLRGTSIANYPKGFQFLASGYLPNWGDSEFHMPTIAIGIVLMVIVYYTMNKNRKRMKENLMPVESSNKFILKLIIILGVIGAITYLFAQYQGFPFVLILIAILGLVYSFIVNETIMGRHIYATGGNIKSAELSGIKTKKITFYTFVNMGVLAALAGMVLAARLNAATPQAGIGLETDTLSAVYFGGASTTGGVGTISGALVGGLVIGILNNGMSILGIGIDWQQFVRGLILLLAVAVDMYNRKKKK